MKPTVYFISGLGADKRVFSLLDLSFCNPVFLDWIVPNKKESLSSYAARMREQIKTENPIVVGISFGGMLLTEMAKADASIQPILISSNPTGEAIPAYLRFGKYLPLYRVLPDPIMKRFMLANLWILGGKGQDCRKIIRQIIIDSDTGFVKWAIKAILNWKNKEIPPTLIKINGKSDRLLPFRRVKADYVIDGGTHLVTLDQPKEISELLKKLILK